MPNNPFGIDPQLWSKIQNLRLLDNLLMQTAMDGFIPGVQLILRIILNMPDLKVTELTVQKLLPHVLSREVTLDVKAEDAAGRHFSHQGSAGPLHPHTSPRMAFRKRFQHIPWRKRELTRVIRMGPS